MFFIDHGGPTTLLGSEYAAARAFVDLAATELSYKESTFEWLEGQQTLGRSVSLNEVSAYAFGQARAKNLVNGILMTGLTMAYGSLVGPRTLGRSGYLASELEDCAMCQASCFTAGTPVATDSGTKPIEMVQPGDRVESKDHALCIEPIDPSACRMVTVEMQDPYGYADTLTARFLRPVSWVQESDIEPGKEIPLRIDELRIDGAARVTSVDACHIAEGTGCLVTGTVNHLNSSVLRLHFVGSEETLEPTATHRLWSANRDGWVAAGELQIGERLVTESGTVTVAQIERIAGKHRVFNFEVAGAHTYLVSGLRIKSHNAEDCGVTVLRPSGQGSDIYGVIRITENGAVEIAVSTRGTKAHVNLATEMWGPLQTGERRYGFFSEGGLAMVTNTSVGAAPAGADVIPVLRALEAAGFTDDVAVGTTWYPAGPK